MKTELFNIAANNIWKKAVSNSPPFEKYNEFDLQKQISNFFHLGNSFYWILNIGNYRFDWISNECRETTGYDVLENSLEFFMDKIHVNDRAGFLNFENTAADFLASLPLNKLMKYKIAHDFRFQKKNGEYIRLLNQSMIAQHNETGKIIRTIGSCTDITFIKIDGIPSLSFIGFDNEPSYYNVTAEEIFISKVQGLTIRERQILKLIIEGNLSKEISEKLHISKQTVDSHRKNMIMKNDVKSTAELVFKAIKKGWI